MKPKHKNIPTRIDGTLVESVGDPLDIGTGLWVTLVPERDDEDTRVWEFDLISGRILQTHD